MRFREFSDILKDAVKDFFRRPVLLPTIGFLIFVFAATFVAGKLANFSSSWGNIIWTISFFLVFLFVGSFFLGTMISIVACKKNYWKHGAQKTLQNFFALVVFSILYWIIVGILYVITEFMLALQPTVVLSILQFKILAFLILFAYTAGFFVFFSFVNVHITIGNVNFLVGIKKSFQFARREYIATLFVNVLFFVLYYFIAELPQYVGEAVEYLIFLPLFVIILTKFVLRK